MLPLQRLALEIGQADGAVAHRRREVAVARALRGVVGGEIARVVGVLATHLHRPIPGEVVDANGVGELLRGGGGDRAGQAVTGQPGADVGQPFQAGQVKDVGRVGRARGSRRHAGAQREQRGQEQRR